MIKVGITGGIGSGKTTVVNFFKKLGVPFYIADDRAKALMNEPPLKNKLVALFGKEAYNDSGELNRSFVAQQVFGNAHLLEQLNGLVHPQVEIDFENWVKNQEAPYVVYEAAILFETGRYKVFDYTILVTAPREERIARVKARDATNTAKIKERMKHQWPDKKKEELADWVIVNTDLDDTYRQVLRLHNILSRN